MTLSKEVVEEFQTNGAVCLRQVFSPEWIEKIRSGIAKNLASPSSFSEALKDGPSASVYFNDYFNWKNIPEFRNFVYSSPAAEIVRDLIQSSTVTFYHEHVLVKESGAMTETPWHQDQSYYPFNGDQACSIWLPVDPVALETTLKFVRGSHKTGWYYPRKFASSLNYPIKPTMPGNHDLNVYRDVPKSEEIPDQDILQWQLSLGDCLVFHMKTLHGANGNSTGVNRRILSTRWFGDDVTMANRMWDPSPPFTGKLNVGDHPSVDQDMFPTIIGKEDQN